MKIDKNKYLNILGMLRSPDDENKIVAMTIIEQLDFKNNIAKILLLKKHSDSTNKLWEEHAPDTFNYMKELSEKKVLDINKHISFKQVLRAISLLKLPPEDFEFYMQDFSEYLLTQVHSMGYDFIEEINITVKTKTHEQTGELSESN
jgi:hypothetical protein